MDTLGVSAGTKWTVLIPPLIFSFLLSMCYVFLWLNLTFNSIWHQGSMTYCNSKHILALPFKTTSDSKIAALSHSKAVVVSGCRIKTSRISIVLEIAVTSSCCEVRLLHSVLHWPQWRSPPFYCSFKAFFPGRQSYRLFVAWVICQRVWRVTCFTLHWKRPMRECLSSLKLQPWAPVLQPDDWQEKWGEPFCWSLTKTPIRSRGKQQIRLLISICSPLVIGK